MTGTNKADQGIDHCTRCGLPAHASETNDDGVCAGCRDEVERILGVRRDEDGDDFCAEEGGWRPGDDFAGAGVDVEQRFDFGGGDA